MKNVNLYERNVLSWKFCWVLSLHWKFTLYQNETRNLWTESHSWSFISGKMEKYEWLDEFQHLIPVLNFPWMFGQPKWFCNREQRKFLHGNFLLSHWPVQGNIDYLSGINIYFLESKNENQLPSRAVLHIVVIYIGNGLKTVTVNSWSWRQLL